MYLACFQFVILLFRDWVGIKQVRKSHNIIISSTDRLMIIGMRLVVAVLLCAGLAAADSPAASCRRPDEDETLWFCDLEDTEVSIERAINKLNHVRFLVMCDDDAPPLPCDLIPQEAASPALENAAITLTVKRCQFDLGCLLTTLNVTGENFKTVSIKADIPPPVEELAGFGNIQSLTLEGVFKNSLRKTVPVSTLNSMQSLTSFSMRKGKLSFPPGGFAQPSSLTTLQLSEGRLIHLPPGVFKGLNKLKRLDLYNNKLRNLTEETLEGLSSLEELELSRNRLHMLSDLVRVTPSLKTLAVENNKLQAVPVVAGLQHLEKIALNNNKITTLAPNAFADLPALKTLSLEHNQISTLPATMFRNSNNIQTIYLFANKIEELPADVFKGLSSLRELHLSENHLRTLPPSVFQDCSSLVELTIAENQLSQLPAGVFQSLTALERLRLEHNKLEELPDNLFPNQPHLKFLHLSHNSLRRVAPTALAGALLFEVDLSNNKLTTVYNTNTAGTDRSTPYDGHKHLYRLNLSHNKIRDKFPPGSELADFADLTNNP